MSLPRDLSNNFTKTMLSLTLIWVGVDNFTPCWFSLNNSEKVKAVTLAFPVFSNISLEKFVPNLVSLTRPSLQILNNTQTGILPISGFLDNPLKTKLVTTPEQAMILT